MPAAKVVGAVGRSGSTLATQTRDMQATKAVVPGAVTLEDIRRRIWGVENGGESPASSVQHVVPAKYHSDGWSKQAGLKRIEEASMK